MATTVWTDVGFIAAVIGSIALAIQTFLSVQISLSPPTTAIGRRVYYLLLAAVCAIGVVAGAYSAALSPSGKGLLDDIRQAMSSISSGVQQLSSEYGESTKRLSGSLRVMADDRELAEQIIIVMLIRDKYLRQVPGYEENWPPESYVNAELERLNVDWRVTIANGKLDFRPHVNWNDLAQ
jgi:hypothetical protein